MSDKQHLNSKAVRMGGNLLQNNRNARSKSKNSSSEKKKTMFQPPVTPIDSPTVFDAAADGSRLAQSYNSGGSRAGVNISGGTTSTPRRRFDIPLHSPDSLENEEVRMKMFTSPSLSGGGGSPMDVRGGEDSPAATGDTLEMSPPSSSSTESSPLVTSGKGVPVIPQGNLVDNLRDDPVVKNYVENLMDQHTAEIQDYEDLVSMCETQVQDLQNQCNRLKKENEGMKATTSQTGNKADAAILNTYMTNQLEQSEDEMEGWEKMFNNLEEQLTKEKDKNAELEVRLSNLQEKSSDQLDGFVSLDEYNSLQLSHQQLLQELNKQQEANGEWKAYIDRQDKCIIDLENQMGSAAMQKEEMVRGLTKQVNELNGQLKELDGAVSHDQYYTVVQEYDQCLEEKSVLDQQVADLTSTFEAKIAHLAAQHSKELAGASDKLSASEQEGHVMYNTVETLTQEIADLKDKLHLGQMSIEENEKEVSKLADVSAELSKSLEAERVKGYELESTVDSLREEMRDHPITGKDSDQGPTVTLSLDIYEKMEAAFESQLKDTQNSTLDSLDKGGIWDSYEMNELLLQEDVSPTDAGREEYIEQLQNERKELIAANAEWNQYKTDVERCIDGYKAEISSKEEDISSVKKMFEEMKARYNQSESKLQVLESMAVAANDSPELGHVMEELERLRQVNGELSDENEQLTKEQNEWKYSKPPSSPTKLSKANWTIEDLHLQITYLTREKDDILADVEQLKIRLENKDSRIDKLVDELEAARTDALSREHETNQHAGVSELYNQLLEKDQALLSLRREVEDSKQSVSTLSDELAAKQEEFKGEQANCALLRDLMNKVKMKDETTEEILAAIKEERDLLTEQLQSVSLELSSQSSLLGQKQQDHEGEVLILRESKERLYIEVNKNEQTIQKLEEDLSMIRGQLSCLSDNNEDSVQQLSAKMGDLLLAKQSLEATVQQDHASIGLLNKTIEEQNRDLNLQEKNIQSICKMVGHVQSSIAKQSQSLLRQVEVWVSKFDSRLTVADGRIHQMVTYFSGYYTTVEEEKKQCLRELEASEEWVRQEREKSDSYLIALEESKAIQEDLRYKLDDAIVLQQEMEEECHQLRNQQEESSVLLNQSGHGVGVDLLLNGSPERVSLPTSPNNVASPAATRVLHDRVDILEQNVVDVTVQQAKSFSCSTRNVAFLEAEHFRLSILVDHLRLENGKLLSDLKVANSKDSDIMGLTYQLQTVKENESIWRLRTETLEASLKEKSLDLEEYASLQERKQSQLEHDFDQQISDLSNSWKASDLNLQQLQLKYESVQLEYEDLQKLYSDENELHSIGYGKCEDSLVEALDEKTLLSKTVESLEAQLAQVKEEFQADCLVHQQVIDDHKEKWQLNTIAQEAAARSNVEGMEQLTWQVDAHKKLIISLKEQVSVGGVEVEQLRADLTTSRALLSQAENAARIQEEDMSELRQTVEQLETSLGQSHKKEASSDVEWKELNEQYSVCCDKLAEMEVTNRVLSQQSADDAAIGSRMMMELKRLMVALRDSNTGGDDAVGLSHVKARGVDAIGLSLGGDLFASVAVDMELPSQTDDSLASFDGSVIGGEFADDLAGGNASMNTTAVSGTGQLLPNLQSSLDRVRGMVDSVLSEKLSWKVSQSQFRLQLQHADQENAQLLQEIGSLKAEGSNWKHQISQAEQQLQSVQDTVSLLQKDKSSLEEQCTDHHVSVSQEVQDMREMVKEAVSELNATLSGTGKDRLRVSDIFTTDILLFSIHRPAVGDGTTDDSVPGSSADVSLVRDSANLIQETVKEVSKIFAMMQTLLSNVVSENVVLKRSQSSAQRTDNQRQVSNQALEQENQSLSIECEELRAQNKQFESNATQYQHQLENSMLEIQQLQEVVDKYAHDQDVLEAELDGILSSKTELQVSVKDLESYSNELKDQLVSVREDVSQKELELSINVSQVQVLQNKSVSEGVQLETLRSSVGRLRSEVDAADDIRRTLEGEVKRLNDQLQLGGDVATKSGDATTVPSRVTTLEMDKLLSKTDTVLKEVCLVLGPSVESKVFDSHSDGNNPVNAGLIARMESTNQYLNRLRVCVKDGTRVDQLFESKYLALQAECAAMTSQYQEVKKQLKAGKDAHGSSTTNEELHQIILELKKSLLDRTKELERVKALHESSVFTADAPAGRHHSHHAGAMRVNSEELERTVRLQEVQIQSLNSDVHSRDESLVLYKDQMNVNMIKIRELNSEVNSKESVITDLEQGHAVLTEELNQVKYTVTTLQEQVQSEQSHRLRADAMHQKLKQAHDDLSVQLQEALRFSASSVESSGVVQDEVRRLRLVLADKDGQLRDFTEEKQLLDNEYKSLQAMYEEQQQTVNYHGIKSVERAAELRREGNEASQSIAQAVTQVREVVRSLLSLDMGDQRSAGEGDSFTLSSVADEEFSVDVFAAGQKLGSSLGVGNLQDAVLALASASPVVSNAARLISAGNAKAAQLEADKAVLEKQNKHLVKVNEESAKLDQSTGRTRQLAVQQLHDRKVESLVWQVKECQEEIASGKKEKEQYEREVLQLQDRLDQCAAKLRGADNTNEQMAGRIEQLEQQIVDQEVASEALEAKVAADNHHKDVLGNTIERLEKSFRSYKKAVDSGTAGGGNEGSSGTGGADAVRLEKQLHHYRMKVAGLEDVVQVYRQQVMALYPDGSTFGAAQFRGVKTGRPNDMSFEQIPSLAYHHHPYAATTSHPPQDMCWIEREIDLISKSYRDEIRGLELELSEAYGRVEREQAYGTELQKKYEENTKYLFRHGASDSTSAALQSHELIQGRYEEQKGLVRKLTQEVSQAKQQCRHHHASLVTSMGQALTEKERVWVLYRQLESVCIQAGLEVPKDEPSNVRAHTHTPTATTTTDALPLLPVSYQLFPTGAGVPAAHHQQPTHDEASTAHAHGDVVASEDSEKTSVDAVPSSDSAAASARQQTALVAAKNQHDELMQRSKGAASGVDVGVPVGDAVTGVKVSTTATAFSPMRQFTVSQKHFSTSTPDGAAVSVTEYDAYEGIDIIASSPEGVNRPGTADSTASSPATTAYRTTSTSATQYIPESPLVSGVASTRVSRVIGTPMNTMNLRHNHNNAQKNVPHPYTHLPSSDGAVTSPYLSGHVVSSAADASSATPTSREHKGSSGDSGVLRSGMIDHHDLHHTHGTPTRMNTTTQLPRHHHPARPPTGAGGVYLVEDRGSQDSSRTTVSRTVSNTQELSHHQTAASGRYGARSRGVTPISRATTAATAVSTPPRSPLPQSSRSSGLSVSGSLDVSSTPRSYSVGRSNPNPNPNPNTPPSSYKLAASNGGTAVLRRSTSYIPPSSHTHTQPVQRVANAAVGVAAASARRTSMGMGGNSNTMIRRPPSKAKP